MMTTENLSPYALAAGKPSTQQLAAGAALFHAGDPVRQMYFVVSGQLAMRRVLNDGRIVPVSRAAAGETIAEPSLFADHYHCDCIALAPSTLLAYRKVDVLGALMMSPQHAMRLMRHLAGEVQDLRGRLEVLSLAGAAPRILAYVSARLGPDCDSWIMDRTWKTVAGELGISHEALYRALARLERDGRLVRDGRQVRLGC